MYKRQHVYFSQIVTRLKDSSLSLHQRSPQSAWDTERFTWRWKHCWSWKLRHPPGRAECLWPDDLAVQPLISDQEPSAESARAYTLPIPPASPRRAQWEIELLVGY